MAYTFISGATGGLGKAFSIACAKNGYNLFVTGRSVGKLSALKEEIVKVNGKVKVITFPCDLTSEKDRAALIDSAVSNGVVFDRIINVAGVDTQMPFVEYTMEKLLFQLRVNAEATVALTYELLKLKAEKTELITISSMSGVTPMPYFALYSATKAMLTNLFTSLHYELKGSGVKVTTVLPGGIPTRPDLVQAIKEQGLWGKLSAKSPEYVAEKSLKAVKKNKIILVPGGFNKFLYCLMKIAPKRIVLHFIEKRWKNLRKDAF